MCRKELVPKNEDREEVDKLRENLGSMHMAMDEMEDYMYDLKYTICLLQHEVNVMSKGPCAICGCSSECDIFRDRICFCDSCQNSGCVYKYKWRRQWEDMSIDDIKGLNI